MGLLIMAIFIAGFRAHEFTALKIYLSLILLLILEVLFKP
jgi:hypothetical protein